MPLQCPVTIPPVKQAAMSIDVGTRWPTPISTTPWATTRVQTPAVFTNVMLTGTTEESCGVNWNPPLPRASPKKQLSPVGRVDDAEPVSEPVPKPPLVMHVLPPPDKVMLTGAGSGPTPGEKDAVN
jgi:hypothetical protein